MHQRRNDPQRSCIFCRKSGHKSDLVRYVVSPENRLLVDYRQRLSGRGAYTCFSSACLHGAVKKNSFSRGLKQACPSVDAADLQRQLLEAVTRRAMNLIGMARKSGHLIAGTQVVQECLKRVELPELIILAEDISPTIGTKICGLAEKKGLQVFHLLTKHNLGKLLGKEQHSAVAVAKGPLADALGRELMRFAQLVREN